MTARGILRSLLLAFVAVSGIVLVLKETRHVRAVASADSSRSAETAARLSSASPSPAQPPASRQASESPSSSLLPTQGANAPRPEVRAGLPPSAAAPRPAAPRRGKLVVSYLHTSTRCFSCIQIEDFTSWAVHQDFAQEIADGRLEWRVLNVDEPENAHFTKDYQLYTKSVILSWVEDGRETRWKNLERVWKLLDDQKQFQDYVVSEIRAFSGAAG